MWSSFFFNFLKNVSNCVVINPQLKQRVTVVILTITVYTLFCLSWSEASTGWSDLQSSLIFPFSIWIPCHVTDLVVGWHGFTVDLGILPFNEKSNRCSLLNFLCDTNVGGCKECVTLWSWVVALALNDVLTGHIATCNSIYQSSVCQFCAPVDTIFVCAYVISIIHTSVLW